MLPGKGISLELQPGVLEFVTAALVDDLGHGLFGDGRPAAEIMNDLVAQGWTRSGEHEVYRGMRYRDGELRVSLVDLERDAMKLDIREWVAVLR